LKRVNGGPLAQEYIRAAMMRGVKGEEGKVSWENKVFSGNKTLETKRRTPLKLRPVAALLFERERIAGRRRKTTKAQRGKRELNEISISKIKVCPLMSLAETHIRATSLILLFTSEQLMRMRKTRSKSQWGEKRQQLHFTSKLMPPQPFISFCLLVIKALNLIKLYHIVCFFGFT